MKYFLYIFLSVFNCAVIAANVAYIHGDVAPDGTIPSGSADPYDQMLLTDTGNTGLSSFKQLVESQGHSISQYYDADTTLTSSFLNNYDVVIFGLHQKLWSTAEKNALNNWLVQGGGMMIYSDSASGGFFREVGAQNTVGQTTTNNLIEQYGMQVTVDQAAGREEETATVSLPGLNLTNLVLQGEGVSPVAISDDQNIRILIPYTQTIRHDQNITITDPIYASLALRTVESGHIAVMFDRQPMWNSGPGSDITKFDNEEILRRLINFLAVRPVITDPHVTPDSEFNVVAPILFLLDEPY